MTELDGATRDADADADQTAIDSGASTIDLDAATPESGPTDGDADAGRTDAACPSGPYASSSLGSWFIEHDPVAREWLIRQGADVRDRIQPSGATRSNALWEAHAQDPSGKIPELSIEAQRIGADLVEAGLAEIVNHPSDPAYTDSGSMLDLGLKAIEWGLAQRSKTATNGFSCNDTSNPDVPPNSTPDSWPCERGGDRSGSHSLHPKSEFIEAAASSLKLIVDAAPRLPRSYLSRVTSPGAALDQLDAVGQWLMGQGAKGGDVWDFQKIINDADAGTYDPGHANFNQQLFVPAALLEVSVLVSSAPMKQTATTWLTNPTSGVLKEERVVAGTTPPESVLPENAYVGLDGFDASYQTVSIDLLIGAIGFLPPGDALRDQALWPVLTRAYNRFDAALVKPAGSAWQVDGAHAHNTRTCECGTRMPDAGELTVPLRMRRYGWLSGLVCSASIGLKADAVKHVGQTLSHYEDCSSAGSSSGDLCVNPF